MSLPAEPKKSKKKIIVIMVILVITIGFFSIVPIFDTIDPEFKQEMESQRHLDTLTYQELEIETWKNELEICERISDLDELIEFADDVRLGQDVFWASDDDYDYSVSQQNELGELFTELTQCIDQKRLEFQ